MIHPLHAVDLHRRSLGALMDAAGAGPEEAPFRVIASSPAGFRVRAYGGRSPGPLFVIVAAPIKRAYIWDLAPGDSAVRACLAAGLDVRLIEWTEPEAGGADHGLADHAGRFIREALDAIEADRACAGGGGRRVLLAGHSLGGTLAAIFAARHPERVRGLALLEAPLAFGRRAGAFASVVQAAPSADRVRAGMGAVPGSFLTAVSVAAAPDAFVGEVWRDRLASLADPAALRLHAKVIRWAFDEFPMPGRLFEDIVEDLYRRDLFLRNRLPAPHWPPGGRPEGRPGAWRMVGAGDLRLPTLAVVDPRSRVAPADSTLAALSGDDLRVLRYDGDVGTALRHVGVLVGRSAHRTLWPAITAWAMRTGAEGA